MNQQYLTSQIIANAMLSHLTANLSGEIWQEPQWIKDWRAEQEAAWVALGPIGRSKVRARRAWSAIAEYFANVWHALKGGGFEEY